MWRVLGFVSSSTVLPLSHSSLSCSKWSTVSLSGKRASLAEICRLFPPQGNAFLTLLMTWVSVLFPSQAFSPAQKVPTALETLHSHSPFNHPFFMLTILLSEYLNISFTIIIIGNFNYSFLLSPTSSKLFSLSSNPYKTRSSCNIKDII